MRSSACRRRSTRCSPPSGQASISTRDSPPCVGAAAAKPRLDVRHPQRHQQRPDPGTALSRQQPGDRHRRRPRRYRAAACRRARAVASAGSSTRAGGNAPGRAHVHQVRRRPDQAQSLGRGDRRTAAPRKRRWPTRRSRWRCARPSGAASASAPTRARAESVKHVRPHGIEIIYHASFADEEALDLLEAQQGQALRGARPRLAGQHRAQRRATGASSPDRRSDRL